MSRQFLDEVKDQLATKSMHTTLQALQERGMQRVRVIRSSQILQLIETAVDRALLEHGLLPADDERDQVVQSTQQILHGMVHGGAAGQRTVGAEASPEYGDAEGSSEQELLDEYRARLEESAQHLEYLQDQVAERDRTLAEREAEVQRAEARSAELNAELQVLHTRQHAANPDALLDELRALRQEIGQTAQVVAPMTDAPTAGIESQIASLGQRLGEEIERIGRKVGVASGAEEQDADLSSLFQHMPQVAENNLDTVKAEERKGSDVADALARMKSLRSAKPS